jgi:hypothetical protein
MLLLLLACLGPVMLGAQEVQSREGVVFILGADDEDPTSPMFGYAEAYVRSELPAHGVRLVTELRSLSQVREYLAAHPPSNGKPWGTLQWVVHGNGRGQMTLPLEPGGDPLIARKLKAALEQGDFPPLPDRLLDAKSEVRIHGCAVGRDPELLHLISVALGGSDAERPLIRASKLYTCYRMDASTKAPVRFLSDAWRVVNRRGQRPPIPELRNRLASLPVDFDCASALQRESPRFSGDVFSHRAPAQFRWTLVFRRREDCPDLSSPVRLRAWLQEQELFHRRLTEAGLEMDQMDWSAQIVMKRTKNSEKPAIEVLGTGEALYLLKSEEDPSIPWEDPRICATTR